ncbi:MAG: tetratricopeptide repeat protein, partial [Cellvibrionaceae bacterium]
QRRDATVAGMVATTEIDRGANSAPDQQAAANQEAAVPASVEQATIHNTSALVAQPAMPGEHQDNRQSVRVSPSKSELDKRLAERAQTLMQQQRLAEAETLLQNHLAGDPDASASRTMLVEVYLASGDLSSARQQVELLTDIPSHARARLTARIDMESGAIQSAIAGLEAARPSLPAEPGYYGFLAALYHRAERFREAADVYEQLLALNSNQATYWLGLAVSLDALNDRSGALRAFRYARLYGRPDAPSRGYVEERIQTLSG